MRCDSLIVTVNIGFIKKALITLKLAKLLGHWLSTAVSLVQLLMSSCEMAMVANLDRLFLSGSLVHTQLSPIKAGHTFPPKIGHTDSEPVQHVYALRVIAPVQFVCLCVSTRDVFSKAKKRV